MDTLHYIGAAIVLLFIAAVGLYAGSKVKTACDFTTSAHKAGSGIVAGSIIGTLVGGASTIGTAQLAFTFGLSAWWFSLGGGIACLILGLFYAKPLYQSGISTMPQLLAREYGQNAATMASILTSMGSFLSIVSQVLSGITLISSVSTVPAGVATVLIVGLMLVYVVAP